jgi:hypothetical protein
MPTRGVTYKEQVERARRTGVYEPLRERVQQLLDEGFTRSEVADIMKMGKSKTELVVAVLGLQVGRGRREIRRPEDIAVTQDLATQRAQEHHWVRVFRSTYGPVGKGFSTA